MFNLQGSELIIILLLALVVLGPEKLPDAMRKAGKFYAELKKMSSGFQSEFRAAVDEPLREFRNTANLLRDSADFTKLQAGEREEKPKSADMLAPADPDAVPTADVPTFETPSDGTDDGPELADDSKPAPFTGQSTTAPSRPIPTPIAVPPPFAAMSSTAPRPAESDTASDADEDAAGGGTDGEADTALADTALADTALADTALADTALADTALADTAPVDAHAPAGDPVDVEPGSDDVAALEPDR